MKGCSLLDAIFSAYAAVLLLVAGYLLFRLPGVGGLIVAVCGSVIVVSLLLVAARTLFERKVMTPTESEA